MSETELAVNPKTDPFITVKVSEQIGTCNDKELLEYQENLKGSNKYHNLQLSKYKALIGNDFGILLKKQFIEAAIFGEKDITSHNVKRFDSANGKQLSDKVICNLKKFHTIKTKFDTIELIEVFGSNELLKPIKALDKELAILEHDMQSQGTLNAYKQVHEKYNDVLTLQSKALEHLKSDKALMKDVKNAEKIENDLNAIAFRRTTHAHRFSMLLNTLKLVAIEGEIDHRAELHNETLTSRKFDMTNKFKAMLADPTE